VAISHSGGIASWYAYLDQVLVERGQSVSKGQLIGTVGRSGAAPRPELAFRLYQDDRPVNPERLLP